MTPLKEWIIWHGRNIKKFTEIIYVKSLQKALEKHFDRQRYKHYRNDIPSGQMDKEALQILQKHNAKE